MEEIEKKNYKTFYYEGIVLVAMEEDEWGQIRNLFNAFPKLVIPAYGIHPWQAHCCFNSKSNKNNNNKHSHDDEELDIESKQLPQMKPGWDERLEKQLRNHPEAFVGEIGIDKVSKTSYGVNEFDLQVQVFEKQMEIASKLQRPVTVHCVRAQGYLFDYFRNNYTKSKKNNNNDKELKTMPPAVMLHSFGGKSDMIKSLLALQAISDKFYFSYSTVINGSNMETLRSNIAATPEDKLLIESDWNSPGPSREGMEEIVQLVSEVKKWTIQQTLGVTSQNARRFFESSRVPVQDDRISEYLEELKFDK